MMVVSETRQFDDTIKMYSERMPARGTLTLYLDGESVRYSICSVKGCGQRGMP